MPTVIGPMPSMRSREDEESEGAAALVGGVTTFGTVVVGGGVEETGGAVVVGVVGVDVVGTDVVGPAATVEGWFPPQAEAARVRVRRAIATETVRFMTGIVRPGHHRRIAVR
ncbi:MAG: hypothetical protein ACR2KK_16655 [Acidimicrobiales bacterium]